MLQPILFFKQLVLYLGKRIKKQTMKSILFLPIIALLFSCGNSKKVTEEVSNSQGNKVVKALIGEFKKSDSFSIKSASISGNKLLLTIEYTGGCTDHQFEFIGSPMIMKSMPPIRAVQLVHNANNDSCESQITEVLEIDIRCMAYNQNAGSEIFLTLEGWDEKLKYIYE